jgi:bifunctional polynucleotide phosphatase/kinase
LPFQIFISTQKDKYYKPSTGMWSFMNNERNKGKHIDKDLSFFVGDAAGRKKDHSDSDKKFAENCGVTFYTEDEFFNKKI